MKASRTALILLGLLVGLAGTTTAQVFVEPPAQELTLAPGKAAAFTLTLTNPTQRTFFVLATVTGNLTSETRLEPDRFQLDRDAARLVNVTVTAPRDTEFESGTLSVLFTIVDRETGDSIDRAVRIAMTLDRPELFVGLVDNPLPPPFDRGWGMFAAELLVWATFSFLAATLVFTVIQHMVPEAKRGTKEEMAAMVKAPLWYLIFVLGLNYSWRLVPASPIIDVFDRLNNAVAILVAGVLAYRGVTAGLLYYADHVADRTETKVDDLLVPVFEKLGAAVVVAVAAFYTFRVLGVDLSFLLAGGLVAGLVISMAAQDTLSNFFSGIFILIDRPFREGDELMLETGEICRVQRIGLRSTRLYHFQNHQEMILPNNELAIKRIINMSYPDRTYRLVIQLGVAYDSDLEKVEEVLLEVAKAHPEVRKDATHEPVVFVKEFGESSIDLELRLFVPNSRRRNPVGTELRVAIKKAFDEHDIEIPFPQRVLWVHGDSAPLRLDPDEGTDSASVSVAGGRPPGGGSPPDA